MTKLPNRKRWAVLWMFLAVLTPAPLMGDEPRSVATFHCLSLYWKADGGASDKACEVRYRRAGQDAWNEALPLWFDKRNGEYRGSIVNLQSGTAYEVQLALKDAKTTAELKAATWSETFPVARTVEAPKQSAETFVVDSSGAPGGYVLYTHPKDAETSTIDVAGKADVCIEVKAAYVILRGLTLKGAKVHGIRLGDGAHDVVIEGCDISGWGRVKDDGWGADYDSAIWSRSRALERLVVQRNRLHDPRSNSNSWKEFRKDANSFHPQGPQGISLFDSAGNHVIRYNEFTTDANHYCNDIFGGGSNFGERGFPNRDSDIYGNRLEGCWDDGIESEGANCNVRIWGNFIDRAYVKIAIAGCSIGPVYIWRNVGGSSRTGPEADRGGPFLKMGARKSSGGGRAYVFHNTLLQPPLEGKEDTGGCDAALAQSGGVELGAVISRNNILHGRKSTWGTIRDKSQDPGTSYDYDLVSGNVAAAEGQEKHGIKGVPVYQNPGKAGDYTLAPGSPGLDAGVRIPNFNDDLKGKAPDVGAHEAGTPPMEFGVKAYLNPGANP